VQLHYQNCSESQHVSSYLFIIAVAHFIPVFEDECDISKELKGVSKETRQLYNLTTDSRGGIPVYVVRTDLITSTADSTVNIFEGHSSKPDVCCLVTKESYTTKGTNSVYSINDSNTICGTKVKITWTFSGGGTCAPLFITVSGLNGREMPPGKDLIVLKIPDICIGDSGVGYNAQQQHEYVVFVRRGSCVNKMRFQFYQKHVLVPYINWLRKEYAGFETTVGSNIPDELTAVSDLHPLLSTKVQHI